MTQLLTDWNQPLPSHPLTLIRMWLFLHSCELIKRQQTLRILNSIGSVRHTNQCQKTFIILGKQYKRRGLFPEEFVYMKKIITIIKEEKETNSHLNVRNKENNGNGEKERQGDDVYGRLVSELQNCYLISEK
ncbi:CLUMA_CG008201, isoform A [Clunio marinus]|uniref:CLUMA_CG008201, isoform A n=1 Tax=Clunio marinus TaxID=568069 RepID=A0A1J1I336_9DIPT|nr:CLUMA_CG008201, isoform A [Clunio marinus]